MVKKARTLEMQYMEELKVLEDSDRDACLAETGRPPIPTDWVDINKGDSLRPNYRSRLVCQETRGRSTIDVEDWAATFAATPPYEDECDGNITGEVQHLCGTPESARDMPR